LHIAAVAGWLGANYVQLLLARRFARSDQLSALAWTRASMWLGQRYYPVVAVVILASGVLLVLDNDWSWGAGFVWVGLSVVVLGGVIGGAVLAPLTDQLIKALEGGDITEADRRQRRIVTVGLLDTALILIAVLAMVHKWKA
jgi:hypothetical protein